MNQSSEPDERISTGDVEPFECVPHWLLFDARVSGNALRVYLVLRKHRDYQTGEAWPGLSRVAKMVGLSVNSVRRLIRDLESVGAISVNERFNEHGGQTSNLYYVHWDSQDRKGGTQTDERDPLKPTEGSPLPPVVDEQRPISIQDPTKPNLVNLRTIDHFDDFWKAYPRKKGKGQARTAWVKALKKADPSLLIHAAIQYRQWCEQDGTGSQFIAHPSTWLNGERWLDERDEPAPEPVPEHQSRMQGWLALGEDVAYTEIGYPQPSPLELEG